MYQYPSVVCNQYEVNLSLSVDKLQLWKTQEFKVCWEYTKPFA